MTAIVLWYPRGLGGPGGVSGGRLRGVDFARPNPPEAVGGIAGESADM